jgi:spermidine synthase
VDDLPVTLARGDGVLGEVALRRRTGRHAQPVYELIVNGVFLMDTAETSTENLLADAVLDRHASPRRVLVGGLGLGITVMALLADARVEQILVAEIEPLLVDWLRTGLVLPARPAVLDPRVQVAVGDVIDVLRSTPDHSYDAILLDVDNGPAFLVHPQNAAVYKRPVLEQVARVLAPDGVLAVWSADPSPALDSALGAVIGRVEKIDRTIRRDGREHCYHIYLARRITAEPLRLPAAQGG